jgi:hypothetical protein
MSSKVKSLSSLGFISFFFLAKTNSLQRRETSSCEVKFSSSFRFFFLQTNFVMKITISTPKFQGLSFLGEIKSPTAAPRERRPTPKV